jgi:hypothetical protein
MRHPLFRKKINMPVLMNGESNMIINPVGYSPSAVAREFKIVHSLEIAGELLHVIYDEKGPRAAIIKAQPEEINNSVRHRAVAVLEIERRKTVDEDEILAVERFWQDTEAFKIDSIFVTVGNRDFGLATLMYETLVLKCGVVLMSDNIHYPGGKGLWQKIAAESQDLAIFVLDTDTGLFYPYNGQKVVYDGKCIPEDQIWSLDPDESRRGVILVAEDRKKIAAIAA